MWNVEFINILHMRESWTAADQRLQLSEGCGGSRGNHLNTSVCQIAHPATDCQSLGVPGHVPAEPNTLNAARNEEPYGPIGRHPVLPARLRTFTT